MEGRYTRPGTIYQAYGQPLYHDTQSSWVKEEINLEQFLGGQVKIRFVLKSDQGVVADGFYFDDMTVTVADLETGVDDQHIAPLQGMEVSIQPNPASGIINMNYDLGDIHPCLLTVRVYDITGHEIYETSISDSTGKITWDVSSWPSGMYFYSVNSDKAAISSGKLLVR
jgi:hypothetical protein